MALAYNFIVMNFYLANKPLHWKRPIQRHLWKMWSGIHYVRTFTRFLSWHLNYRKCILLVGHMCMENFLVCILKKEESFWCNFCMSESGKNHFWLKTWWVKISCDTVLVFCQCFTNWPRTHGSISTGVIYICNFSGPMDLEKRSILCYSSKVNKTRRCRNTSLVFWLRLLLVPRWMVRSPLWWAPWRCMNSPWP